MTLLELAARWRTEAATLNRYGDDRGALVCRLHADELEQAAADLGGELLNLKDAAGESGYSERRLREMLADGTLPNAGRRHAPRIRRGDLPRKPRSSGAAAGGYDPAEDARSLLPKLERRTG